MTVIFCVHIGIVTALLVSLNITTFIYWGWDKYQAIRHRWRIPEVFLFGLVAIGGTLGAIAGQLIFRHKISKSQFLQVFYTIVVIQVIILTLCMYFQPDLITKICANDKICTQNINKFIKCHLAVYDFSAGK